MAQKTDTRSHFLFLRLLCLFAAKMNSMDPFIKRWLYLIGMSLMIGAALHGLQLFARQKANEQEWDPGPQGCLTLDLPFSNHFPGSESFPMQWSLVIVLFVTGGVLFRLCAPSWREMNPDRN